MKKEAKNEEKKYTGSVLFTGNPGEGGGEKKTGAKERASEREEEREDAPGARQKPRNQILILSYARVEGHAMPGRLY